MHSDDPHWNSRVADPVRQDGAWDDAADVVIVGLGGAGVCAAIEALDAGATVLAIDRFTGGGATRMSGGVYYAGGGTQAQREGGVADDAEQMYRYLGLEVADAVSDATLRDFCDTSVEQTEWLSAHGVRFSGTVSPVKTSYPGKGHFLYHSGNEAQADYADHARPAQRGHRTVGDGLTGHRFFDALRASAMAKGLRLRSFAEARRFILAADGEIAGIEIRQVGAGSAAAKRLAKLAAKFGAPSTLLFPRIAEGIVREATEIMARDGQTRRIRIDRAAVLAAGGYVQNRAMVAHYAPEYLGAIPLGGIGCDGSGIRLGQSVGAAADRLGNMSAWRQFQPPAALATGIVVNARGERFVSEDCYGGRIGHEIARQPGGTAYIILDRMLRRRALLQALPGPGKLFRLQGAPALMGMAMSTKKAPTLEALAAACGMDPALLAESVAHYNRSTDGIEPPRFRKHADFTGRIATPPFYAVDISIGNRRYLCPSISLGGIRVDEASGQALRDDGTPIARLYAAGKNARGISSHRYVSGLSLADCVYSGRIAGRAAARLAGRSPTNAIS